MKTPCDHSPRQVGALLAVTVTTRAGVATRSKRSAALDHRTSSAGPKALLNGTDSSGTHEGHFCESQWVSMGRWWDGGRGVILNEAGRRIALRTEARAESGGRRKEELGQVVSLSQCARFLGDLGRCMSSYLVTTVVLCDNESGSLRSIRLSFFI